MSLDIKSELRLINAGIQKLSDEKYSIQWKMMETKEDNRKLQEQLSILEIPFKQEIIQDKSLKNEKAREIALLEKCLETSQRKLGLDLWRPSVFRS